MDYDVIVVGAGPAGASAARYLADGGAAVALVDGETFPRRKPCAGWVNRQAAEDDSVIDHARRDTDAAPFKRLVFHAPDLEQTAEFRSRSHVGYVARRDIFDAALLDAAEAAGAEVFVGRSAKHINAGERGATVVLTSGKRLRGRVLVGADGVHSPVARATGLRERWKPTQLVHTLSAVVPLTARQVKACYGSSPAIHVSPTFGGATGYAWAFPGRRHVHAGVGARSGEEHLMQPVFAQWLEALSRLGLLPEKANVPRPEGWPIPAGAAVEFENHVGKRTVLIGDAGGFASAATGEGIYPAVRSARLAAGCILAALEADADDAPGSTCQDELLKFRSLWRRDMAGYLQMPNVNISFLLPLIYTNQEICDRFAKAFLFGENL